MPCWKDTMRITMDHKHPNNDWYEELCALAAIGELSSSEFEELQQHLAQCGDCRELYADFGRISAGDLGSLAVLRTTESPGEDAGQVDEQVLLDRLLDRAERESVCASSVQRGPEEMAGRVWRPSSVRRVLHWLGRPALSYGTTGLLLCVVVGVAAFRLKESQLSPKMTELHLQAEEWKNRAHGAEAREETASRLLREKQLEQEGLQKGLAESAKSLSESERLRKASEAQLGTANAQAKQIAGELEAARQRGEQQVRSSQELRTRLDAATTRATHEEFLVDSLKEKLQKATIEYGVNTQPPPQMNDSDAKLILSARDLHIVDMYDVGGDGKTKRSYGRVYYVEKKLLLFYAFDLEDRRRGRTPEGFQAWGYRQANETKPENLGLFSVDDASINRWVLKVNNPRILEHIDAVFVTVEAPNGSPSPRGRKLLYANLAGPANHP
jgi:hypothetical protein